MSRADNITQPSLLRRIFGSALLKMLLFVVLFLFLSTLITGGAGTRVQEKQEEFLADAVRRSAVQCYAIEGRFPENIGYLEENYGLIIDHDNYTVYYEHMGGNLIPQIRVLPLTN